MVGGQRFDSEGDFGKVLEVGVIVFFSPSKENPAVYIYIYIYIDR